MPDDALAFTGKPSGAAPSFAAITHDGRSGATKAGHCAGAAGIAISLRCLHHANTAAPPSVNNVASAVVRRAVAAVGITGL